MMLLSPTWLGIAFGLSEAVLSLTRRAKAGTVKDGGSLALFWTLIPLAMFLAYSVTYGLGWGDLPWPGLRATGGMMVIGGLLLRWYAIVHLRQWFTVNVAIAADQRLVQDGPYRILRHPAYTGALLALIGIGLALGNALALAIIVVMTLPAFLRRIYLEERVMGEAFGAAWTDYCARTYRLLPGIY